MFEVMTRWMTAFLVAATLAVMAPASPCHAASREERVAAVMQRLTADPPALRTFLAAMPKGRRPSPSSRWLGVGGGLFEMGGPRWRTASTRSPTPSHRRPARRARSRRVDSSRAIRASINRASTRCRCAIFSPGTGTGEVNGHDHTFAAFPRFGRVAAAHLADALVVARRQAAADQVLYLETISGPGGRVLAGRDGRHRALRCGELRRGPAPDRGPDTGTRGGRPRPVRRRRSSGNGGARMCRRSSPSPRAP